MGRQKNDVAKNILENFLNLNKKTLLLLKLQTVWIILVY